MTKNKPFKKFGFTLFELVVVIAIIALIAVIAVPATIGLVQKSNEQNDKVLASTYSSYMQKFATEKAGAAEYYDSIDNSGEGSEYSELSQYSGNGAYPGVNKLNSTINDTDNEEEVWRLVRKQACIAIKAYGNVDLADEDNYFVHKPLDKDTAFVYYYLTGKVAIENIADMEKITAQDVKDGAVDTEDYWVYLDREGGSGKAAGDLKVQKDFYVQIYQFGLTPNTPLNGAVVSLKLNDGKTVQATTTSSGLVVFRNVTDELDVFAEMLGAISFPDAEYYPVPENPDNHVVLEGQYDGISATKPYTIFLKVGTLGSLQFNEQVKIFNFDTNKSATESWTIGSNIIGENDKQSYTSIFDSVFTKKPDSALGRNESYLTNLKDNIPLDVNPQELLGVNNGQFRFLMYGDYALNITDQSGVYLPYNEDITSKVYGIDNTAHPKFENQGSPYPYPVTLKRSSTHIYGTIAAENLQQPLHGTHNVFVGMEDLKSDFDSTQIQTYVYAVSKSNPDNVFISNVLTSPTTITGPDGKQTYAYEFNISLTNKNTPQGASDSAAEKYEIFLVTKYGTKATIKGTSVKKLVLSEFPDEILADGSYYVLKTSSTDFVQVNLSEVSTCNVPIEIYENNDKYENNRKYISYTATLYRKGYSGSEFVNGSTKYSVTVNGSSRTNGTFQNVRKGFYYLHIDYSEDIYPDVGSPDSIEDGYVVFIDDNGIDIIFDEDNTDAITYFIVCTPKHADGTTGFTGKTGMLNTKTFNAVTDPAIKFEVTVGGQKLKSDAFTVNYNYNANGSVSITFTDSPTVEGIKITSSVKCFANGTYQKTGTIKSNLTESFIIKRHETIANTDSEHPKDFWSWKSSSSGHWQVCARCDLTRFNSAHFIKKELNGSENAKTPLFYPSTQTLYNSNNNTSTSTDTHVKHCTVCQLYDTVANCSASTKVETGVSGNGWSYYYNLSSKASANHNSQISSGNCAYGNGSKVQFNLASSGSTDEDYHYQYCKDCHQRIASGAHSYETTKNATCVTEGSRRCKLCYETDSIPKTGHNYAMTFYYFASETECLMKQINVKCQNAGCGDTTGSGPHGYYLHVDDVPDNQYGCYANPLSAKWFDWYTHMNNSYHSTYCYPKLSNMNKNSAYKGLAGNVYYAPCSLSTDYGYKINLEDFKDGVYTGIKRENLFGYLYSFQSLYFDDMIGNGCPKKTEYCDRCTYKLGSDKVRHDDIQCDYRYTSAGHMSNPTHFFEYGYSSKHGDLYVFYNDDHSPTDLYGSLHLQNADGTISLAGTFNNKNDATEWTFGYHAFSQCCRPFKWPTDATAYNATNEKYEGKNFNCFHLCEAYRKRDVYK